MLKGIDPRMPADLLDVLMRMGHGDEIAVVDCNFPAHSSAAGTVSGRVVELPGFSAPEAIGLITATNSADQPIACPQSAVPVTSSGATPLVKYVAKTNVMTTVGNAELAQS